LDRECPNAPGQRHDPGTWTDGHRPTINNLQYFYTFSNKFYPIAGKNRK